MEKINDKWIRIGSIALLLFNLFLVDNGPGHRPVGEEVYYVFLYLVFVTTILESSRLIILSMHRRFPTFQQSKRRFWETCLYVFISNVILIPLTFNIFHWVRGMHAGNSTAFFIAVAIGSLILSIIQTGIYESYYNFNRLRLLEKEREELMRNNLQSRFDSLKQQVNPHFLFNSINTVSSLISIDPQRAKRFLSEMSKVYRYLLKANEEELTTLDKELEFLESYFHLLQTRFGKDLQMEISINDQDRIGLIPVLTLQLLVENAVKHNAIIPGSPLKITIRSDANGVLCVQNNLQKKLHTVESNRVGLSTILAKYKLLQQEEPVVKETENEFIVLLPLIQHKVYERINH